MSFLWIALGVGLLYAGGEALLKGSLGLAQRLGLSPLFTGLTVVSLGTSAPELAATLAASVRGVDEMALGNVIGSNIANVGLVLGLTVLIRPLVGDPSIVRREIPLMLAASLALFLVVRDGSVGRVEGALFLAAMAGIILYLLKVQEEPEVVPGTDSQPKSGLLGQLLAVSAGITLLVLGAQALIAGAETLARAWGISERVIGLTMVAFGTSLPELASSMVAAARGESDIVLGNIVGSNMFNILLILGATSLVAPIAVDPTTLWDHLFVMLGTSAGLILLLGRNARLNRVHGVLLFAVYCAYVAYLFV